MNGTSSVCCTSVVVTSSKIEVDGNTVEVMFIGVREVTIASGCILDVTLAGGRTIEVDVTLAGCRVDVMFTGCRVEMMFTGGRVTCSEGLTVFDTCSLGGLVVAIGTSNVCSTNVVVGSSNRPELNPMVAGEGSMNRALVAVITSVGMVLF